MLQSINFTKYHLCLIQIRWQSRLLLNFQKKWIVFFKYIYIYICKVLWWAKFVNKRIEKRWASSCRPPMKMWCFSWRINWMRAVKKWNNCKMKWNSLKMLCLWKESKYHHWETEMILCHSVQEKVHPNYYLMRYCLFESFQSFFLSFFFFFFM